MLRRLGLMFGGAFLLGGALGFVPGVTRDGMYFGTFVVNTPHNLLHIASGVLFLIMSMRGAGAVRLWFKLFGVIYAVIAAWGFEAGDGMICGVISNNRYDSWGHAALALAMLLIGFAIPIDLRADGMPNRPWSYPP